MLDLRQEDIVKQQIIAQSVLASPITLQNTVISAGEKGICVAVQNGLQKVKRAKSVIQEDPATLVKTKVLQSEFIQVRQVRRSKTAVLKKPHDYDNLAIAHFILR